MGRFAARAVALPSLQLPASLLLPSGSQDGRLAKPRPRPSGAGKIGWLNGAERELLKSARVFCRCACFLSNTVKVVSRSHGTRQMNVPFRIALAFVGQTLPGQPTMCLGRFFAAKYARA